MDYISAFAVITLAQLLMLPTWGGGGGGGGTHSRKLNFLARCIWVRSIRHNFWLTASRIPGQDNHIADSFSRNFKEDIEWCLNREVFL